MHEALNDIKAVLKKTDESESVPEDGRKAATTASNRLGSNKLADSVRNRGRDV